MKPREKLEIQGVQQLSDYELISLILGRGNKKENIFECSKRILEKFDHDELINTRNIKDFQNYFQVGYVQSSQLIAAFELGKRLFGQQRKNTYFRTSESVYEYAKEMENLQKEHVRGLYLDTRYKLIYEETLSIGGLNANLLHSREVFQPALEHNAYAIILIHNHPSGDPTPSLNDKKTTEILREAGNLLQIPLLDHLIIGKKCYKSLK